MKWIRALLALVVLLAMVSSASATAIYNATEDRIYVSGTETIHSIWSQVGDQLGKFWKDANGAYHINTTAIYVDDGSTLLINDTTIYLEESNPSLSETKYVIVRNVTTGDPINLTITNTTIIANNTADTFYLANDLFGSIDFFGVALDLISPGTGTPTIVIGDLNDTGDVTITIKDVTVDVAGTTSYAYLDVFGNTQAGTVYASEITLFNWAYFRLYNLKRVDISHMEVYNSSSVNVNSVDTLNLSDVTGYSNDASISMWSINNTYVSNIRGKLDSLDITGNVEVHVSNAVGWFDEFDIGSESNTTIVYVNDSIAYVNTTDWTEDLGDGWGAKFYFNNVTIIDTTPHAGDLDFDGYDTFYLTDVKFANFKIAFDGSETLYGSNFKLQNCTIYYSAGYNTTKLYNPTIVDRLRIDQLVTIVETDNTPISAYAENTTTNQKVSDIPVIITSNETIFDPMKLGYNYSAENQFGLGVAYFVDKTNRHVILRPLQGEVTLESVANLNIGERYTFTINSSDPNTEIEMTFTGLNPYSKLRVYYTKNGNTTLLGIFPANAEGVAKIVYDRGFSTVTFDSYVLTDKTPSEEKTPTPAPYVPPLIPTTSQPGMLDFFQSIYGVIIALVVVLLIAIVYKSKK